jgi:hypothetical protein
LIWTRLFWNYWVAAPSAGANPSSVRCFRCWWNWSGRGVSSSQCSFCWNLRMRHWCMLRFSTVPLVFDCCW